MGASWSLIQGWTISLEEGCQVASDIGISGLLGRIAFVINPNAAIIISIILFSIDKSNSPSTKKLRKDLTTTFKDITSFQLVAASAYLVTALINQDHTSWFHFRFLLDPAIQSCMAAAILSLHHRRTGIEFLLHILNVSVFTGLFIWSGYVYLNQVARAIESGCYDERFKTVCTPFDLTLGIIIVLLLQISACLPAKFKYPDWINILLSAIMSVVIIVDEYLSFTDYEVMKVMLKNPETGADAGQTYAILSAISAFVYGFYKIFPPLLKSPPQNQQYKMHPYHTQP